MSDHATARITAIAPWFGGKRTLADAIIEELGPHRAYWEPFCGSMAVLLGKPACSHETVCDLHGDLVNLAMVLASDRWADIADRLGRTLVCEGLFNSCRLALSASSGSRLDVPASPAEVTQAHVHRAWLYFVVSWAGRNGVSGTRRDNYQMAIRWTPSGGSGGTRFCSAADSVPVWHERLRRVVILNRDAFGILEKIDDAEGVAIYADPPYLMSTRGSGRVTAHPGGSNYLFDFQPLDHVRLAELLGRFRRARVVVSYYDDPQLDELYPASRWTRRAIKANKNLHVQNRRGSTKAVAPEVLLTNGPSYAEGMNA